MSAYPPLLFAGVRVEHVAEDWTSIRVSHRVRAWNRNINGAAFGGTLYAMTDPFFGIMARGQLGDGYRVWSVRSGIEFVAPGRGIVTATMELDAALAEQIREATRDGAKSITTHSTTIYDTDGNTVAHATQDVYVRQLRTAADIHSAR
ncbi:DUF4442 domain-containing protein [Nocardia sp. CDC153]|uniref:DUF4442 domain-containing protein n=1 Tax=Nocardia sp. CDC153 TaxID=3112167 RepID=UPI002DBD0E03|nr:DUF4442 domain-containing protein [Nocardia sp. CDC153]MEC3955159.1 DUF4442 domain-containing protein [Nocardia sp. CDC153]